MIKKIEAYGKSGMKGTPITEKVLEEDGILVYGESVYNTLKKISK